MQRTLREVRAWLFGAIGVGLCIAAIVMLYDPLSTVIQMGSVPEDMFQPLLIAVVMLLGGSMFTYKSVANYRREKVYEEIEDMEEPWTAREAWDNNQIKHQYSKLRLVILNAILLVVSLGLSGWFILDRIVGESNPEWGFLVTIIFPLAGVVTLAIVLKEYRRRRKYGTSVMQLDEMPARLGERFLARVQANLSPHEIPENGIQVQISCYRRTAWYKEREQSINEDNSKSPKIKTKTRVLWRNERHMRPLSQGADSIEIPVSFQLPENRPTSTPILRPDKYLAQNRVSDIIWRVRIRVETDDGIDYDATFEVPVFESEDTSKAPAPTPEEADESVSTEQVFWDLEADEEKIGPASEKAEPAVSDPYDEYVVRPSLNEPISPNISLERDTGYLRLHVAPDQSQIGPYLFGAIGVGMAIGSPFLFGSNFWVGLVLLTFGPLFLWAAYSKLTEEATLTISEGTIDVKGAATFGKSDAEIPVFDFKDVQVLVGGDEKRADYRIVIERHETKLSDERMQEGAGKFADAMGMIVGDEAADQMKTAYDENKHRAASIDGLYNKIEADWLAQQLRDAVEAEKRYA
jgi:hypothetical protein